ncbi:MAG: DnaJ domain-containing protein [Phycisphaerales bacterium]|nr:MAG: DnaJ domain-containing protein [Phycisphaerales bacterium]
MNDMTPEEGFRVLGLPASASEIEAWTAFLRLARRNHPNLHKTRPRQDRFVEIVQAYQVVRAELRRRRAESLDEAAAAAVTTYPGAYEIPKAGPDWERIGEAALLWWVRIMLVGGAAFLLFVVILILTQCITLSFPTEQIPHGEDLDPEYADFW